jgi:hypothetical protein
VHKSRALRYDECEKSAFENPGTSGGPHFRRDVTPAPRFGYAVHTYCVSISGWVLPYQNNLLLRGNGAVGTIAHVGRGLLDALYSITCAVHK